ncbi:MAG: cysteine--tRNA ligase [Candidatus Omnitrophica bacterium]|nr:cysteine--tRNA ligase [Candidatus Omnitrophota bacterium]
MIRLHNTLTRTVEDFKPLKDGVVTMYVCGPTVYDDPHIGHARSAFIFEILRRYLEFTGHQVRFVRNVTDVDDKIIDRARRELEIRNTKYDIRDLGKVCNEVAQRYLKSYHEMMDRLGIRRPDLEPKATEHVIPDMTDSIAKLLIAGVAYEAGGDVYFSVRKCEGYGRLSNRTVDELQAGARVEPGEHPDPTPQVGAGKRDPLDFALWKAAKPGEPSWRSPWGDGRPGWHIECSTMSTKYLGDAIDLHGGGVDLVFPHHENEIAQAQAVGKPFARCWVHNGLLTVSGEKMSKSLGNYITASTVLEAYPHPDYLKLFFLKTHYRSPIDYSRERMDEAKKNWHEFSRFFQHCDQRQVASYAGAEKLPEVTAAQRGFDEAMDDDLNTPKALSVLFDLVNLGDRLLASGQLNQIRPIYDVLLRCGTVVGLFLQGMAEESPSTLQRLQALIAQRDAARQAKDFAAADAIRKTLRDEGIVLSDTENGTFWRRAG